MAGINRKLLTDKIDQFRFNPMSIQGVVHNFVRAVEKGEYDIVNPTNPFVHLVEAAATIGASAMTEANVLNRQQYPLSAQTMTDIYPHMSDRDFLDMFTQPSQAGFIFGFDEQELLSRMVEVPGAEIRKVVIPRNTFVNVGDTAFSLQYPIEIRQMRHEGIQIVYDVEKTTPLQTLKTNYIEPSYQFDGTGRKMIYFHVLLDQFSIVTKAEPVVQSTMARISVDIVDEFYYCRVWNERPDKTWLEVPTTYTDRIYANNRATAIVRVDGKNVSVEIPQYYIQSRAIEPGSRIRVDVYQTKGPIRLDLTGYPANSYEINWYAVDKLEHDRFVAPLAAMQTYYISSPDITFGGSLAMTTDEVRERVMHNGASIGNLPITPAQSQKTIQREGFTVVKDTDHVTNRTYLATQPLPDPVNSELITPASAAINTLIENIQNLAALNTTYENNESLTLTPDTIYRLENGKVRVLNNSEMAIINTLLPEAKAELITSGGYYYTPFHYVLDTSRNQFEARPYYLDGAKLTARSYIAENDTTLMSCSIKEIMISRTKSGYKILVISRGSQSYSELEDDRVGSNLAFRPDRTGIYAYIPGRVVGHDADGDRVWQYDLELSYDIDRNDMVEILNAKVNDLTNISTRIALTTMFELFFTTDMVMPITWEPASFEHLIGGFLLPAGSRGISRESATFELGQSLRNLWSRSSSVVGPEDYATYDIDVPDVYLEDVYVKDPITNAAFTIDEHGNLVYNLKAKKGDPKYNEDGSVKIKFTKGSIKHDAYGMPIVVRGREMRRRVDLMLIEAAYYYATNKAASDYRAELIRNILNWVTKSLSTIHENLLENTEIFYYPTQSAGLVEVVYEDGLKKSIEASQFFDVRLYVRDAVYKDDDLRAALRIKTVEVIGSELKNRTASISNITEALREAYQNDVISFDVSPFSEQLTVVTMVDDSSRLSIRKKLVYREDSSFALEEDVDVQFLKHERTDLAQQFIVK